MNKFYVMGKKRMGEEFEQICDGGFDTREAAAWFAKTMGGRYRWTKIIACP